MSTLFPSVEFTDWSNTHVDLPLPRLHWPLTWEVQNSMYQFDCQTVHVNRGATLTLEIGERHKLFFYPVGLTLAYPSAWRRPHGPESKLLTRFVSHSNDKTGGGGMSPMKVATLNVDLVKTWSLVTNTCWFYEYSVPCFGRGEYSKWHMIW
jgi:hypothetical protein